MEKKNGMMMVFLFACGLQALAGDVVTMRLPELFKAGSTILFQGDSITDGFHRGDMNHVYGHGYACEIASRYQALRPEQELQFANRGISGNTSSNLVERWEKDAFPYAIKENGYENALGRKKGERGVRVGAFCRC